MFLITHAAVGAMIGQAVGHPILAALGGLVSHFLLDIIPHGDAHLYRSFQRREKVRRAVAYVTTDALAAIFFVLALFNFRDFFHPLNVSLGIAFGILPDLLIGLFETGRAPWLLGFQRFHFFFHDLYVRRRRDLPFGYGVLMQIVILVLLQMRIF